MDVTFEYDPAEHRDDSQSAAFSRPGRPQGGPGPTPRVSLAGIDLAGPTRHEVLEVLVQALIGPDHLYHHQPDARADEYTPQFTISKVRRFLRESGFGFARPEEVEGLPAHLVRLSTRRLTTLKTSYKLAAPVRWGDLVWFVVARLQAAVLNLPLPPPVEGQSPFPIARPDRPYMGVYKNIPDSLKKALSGKTV